MYWWTSPQRAGSVEMWPLSAAEVWEEWWCEWCEWEPVANLSMSSLSGANSRLSIRLNSCTKNMKCLKLVFRCASSPNWTTSVKCWWYIWAYTRNRRFSIVFAIALKFLGKGTPFSFKNTNYYLIIGSLTQMCYRFWTGRVTRHPTGPEPMSSGNQYI